MEDTMSIGELARRAGVPVATIRTWEQRYGLPGPARSAGGHRRYGPDDLLRIAAVRELIDAGATPAAAARRASAPPGAPVEGPALEAAYEATRALLRIRKPADAVDVLVELVRALGGSVVDADDAPTDALPIDLSFGERPPLLPVAEPYSVARLNLERVLPTVLDDARHMVLLTRRLQAARVKGVAGRA
jgi:DNA-binding transcriptional MerR regulator